MQKEKWTFNGRFGWLIDDGGGFLLIFTTVSSYAKHIKGTHTRTYSFVPWIVVCTNNWRIIHELHIFPKKLFELCIFSRKNFKWREIAVELFFLWLLVLLNRIGILWAWCVMQFARLNVNNKQWQHISFFPSSVSVALILTTYSFKTFK